MRTRILALALLLSACGRTGLLAPARDGGTGGHAGGDRASTGGTSGRGCNAGEGAWCITEFPIPTAGASASRITAGPDGNLWFTESASEKIGRITPDGAITEFPLTVGQDVYHHPYGITKGPDGALWFTEATSGEIASITTDGHITRQPRYRFGTPLAIVFAADGTVWLTGADGAIDSLTLGGNVISHLADLLVDWRELTTATDGAVWACAVSGNLLGRCPLSGACTTLPLPAPASYPYGITVGPDDAIWFTEVIGNRIGRVGPDGAIDEFALPTPSRGARIITAGSDGALWFTEHMTNQIGRLTVDGQLDELEVPTPSSSPAGITAGPDGNVWFTEELGNRIGRITLAR